MLNLNRGFVVSKHEYKGFYWCAECGCLVVQWCGVIVEFDYGWVW